MGGQETMFLPLWREYLKDPKERILHRCTCSSHTASCRTVRKCLVSHICSRAGPWGWVQEEVKESLYIYRILQACWGWLKSFAWVSGHSCKEKLFPGTFTDLWSCIHCSRDYTTSQISYLLPPFRGNPDVLVRCPAWKGPSSSQTFSQVSMLGRGLSQPPLGSSLHRNLLTTSQVQCMEC